MGVVKYKDGWLVKIWIQGVYIQKYFKDKSLAETVYLELKKKQELAGIAKKLRGVDEGLAKLLGSEFQKGELIKLKVFWGGYFKWLLTHKKETTIRERLYRWRKLKEFFGEKTLLEITAEEVSKFQSKLKEAGYTSASINRYIALLRHMLSMAVKWNYLKEHPFKGKIEMLRETQDKWTFLTKDEFIRLKEAIGDTYKDLFCFLVYTGARLGEALRLKWKDIIWEARVAYLSDSKSNRPRVLVLGDNAFDLLKERYKRLRAQDEKKIGDEERVFEHSDSWFRRALKKALKECNIRRNVRIHDLRHTFASWLSLEGVTLHQIKELLGHVEIRTTMRYAHLNVEALRAALNNAFERIEKDSFENRKTENKVENKVIRLSDYLNQRGREKVKGGI